MKASSVKAVCQSYANIKRILHVIIKEIKGYPHVNPESDVKCGIVNSV